MFVVQVDTFSKVNDTSKLSYNFIKTLQVFLHLLVLLVSFFRE